jgi:hypothetical protein
MLLNDIGTATEWLEGAGVPNERPDAIVELFGGVEDQVATKSDPEA